MENLYIFGGHALAANYRDELLTARDQGNIAFTDIFCIDADPACVAAQRSAKHWIERDPAHFILEYLRDPPNDSSEDGIVPDHTAQHVFLKVFLQLAQSHPHTRAHPAPWNSNLNTPFLHKNEDASVWAVSYATWICPTECDEPAICPHIEAKRDWDFNVALNDLRKTLPKTTSLHLFACRPLLRHIVQIPCTDIQRECALFLQRLATDQMTHALIGTHSHCHGILGHIAIEGTHTIIA